MGAIADGFAAFAQPLFDQTDGSMEQLNKALAIGQVCFNLAIMPEDERDGMLAEMQESFGMDDAEFADFRSSIVMPMIRRHEQMFPLMHQRVHAAHLPGRPSSQSLAQTQMQPRIEAFAERQSTASVEQHAVTDRYAPCPCGSGKKYKFCCGLKRR